MNPSGKVQFVYVVGDVLPEEIDDSTIYVVGTEKKAIYVGSKFIVSDLTADFEQLRTYIENYLGSQAFIGDVVTALQAMVTSGDFAEAVSPVVAEQLPSVVASQIDQSVASQISTPVSNWLSQHVDPESQVVIDDTLTIQGAAADAKAAGDGISQLKSALKYLPWAELYDKNEVSNGYLKSDGTIQEAQGWYVSGYMPITPQSDTSYKGLTTVGVAPMSGFFDSNKVFISPSFKQATGTNSLPSIPPTAAFVRFSINEADLNTFSLSIQKLPSFDDLENLHDSVFNSIPVELTLDSSASDWTKKSGYIATQNAWSENSSYDSYYFTADSNSYIYCSNAPVGQYVQLAVYPSGDFGDPNYARYRNSDSNLPTSENKLFVSKGTMVIASVTKNSTTFEFKYDFDKEEVKGIDYTKYFVSYAEGVLTVKGRGLNCSFSDETFEHTNGLFELQDLTINDCLIFGTENDYIGPVKVKNEIIIGAKHGGETTDSVKIFADGVEMVDGDSKYADSVSIYITSHIDTRFSRVSTYTISFGKLSASSLIVQNADLNIESIFGAGIISSYDDSTLAWINNYLLSSGDTTGDLGEQTIIVTKNGNVTSRRTFNKSPYTNSPVYFLTYSGRKKLYYYNTYRVQNTDLPSGSVYSSSADLLW